MKVSIIGATGYSGLEVIRYLHTHPYVEIVSIHSQTENQSIDTFYPYLKGLLSLPLEPINPEKIMAQSDLVFLALPSGISKEVAAPFVKNGFPLIDLSGDFRLEEQGAYEKWYKKEAAHYPLIEAFDYGLAEYRADISKPFIANPGCYATAAELSFAPLLQEQLIELDSIIIDGKSGLSGAGKGLTQASHFIEANDNMSVYKMNEHQHIPEIIQQFQRWEPALTGIQFTTSLIPVTRGIFMTAYAKPKNKIEPKELLELYRRCYEGKTFIRIQEENRFPVLKQIIGTNFCDIGLSVNEATGMITLVTTIDNLGKGAAGQAIQNMNLFAGFSETEGLLHVSIYP
ncbi:N-acetyl-gamma-glutamyl-phosphate reductase [Candidatus Enterococcus clewellii]|uniref:N-acetyl-gamma-glutamyl-phosphate reductase n=1 Tax=Candidatus Enterococcus clewellii TaxID=1834193 RepID=A0A242KB58_9ENTE|nr:N-acetyl-gamma-glutamyl-phosphate reductase [Enterococcus sp. 9E7_DIV0242]OTP18309.1 N-acetyl-gamma-glutamyl-phosphate reductase [Enterococcus sp. 9E7_DIV0242]